MDVSTNDDSFYSCSELSTDDSSSDEHLTEMAELPGKLEDYSAQEDKILKRVFMAGFGVAAVGVGVGAAAVVIFQTAAAVGVGVTAIGGAILGGQIAQHGLDASIEAVGDGLADAGEAIEDFAVDAGEFVVDAAEDAGDFIMDLF